MNQDTLLHRQVHPSFRQFDSVSAQAFIATSQAFAPTSKDAGKLSVYNGDKYTAQESFEHFLQTETNSSCGVLSVTPAECDTNTVKSEEDNDPFDGHAFIDFRDKGNNQVKAISKKLRDCAISRGWQHVSEG